MRVIPATIAHAAEIANMCRVLNTQHYTCSDMRDVFTRINSGECFIALHEEKVVGAMYLVVRDKSCEIETIVSCMKGGGRALIEYAVEHCMQQGIAKLWCWSLVKYNAAGFYQKMGFTEMCLMHKQWFGEDCYYFGRTIPVHAPLVHTVALQVAPRP